MRCEIATYYFQAKTVSSQGLTHPFGPPSELREAVSVSFRQLSLNQQGSCPDPSTLEAIRRKLVLYLGSANTVAIILRPIENGVVKAWRKLAAVIGEHYSEEDRMVIGCPTDNQASCVWLYIYDILVGYRKEMYYCYIFLSDSTVVSQLKVDEYDFVAVIYSEYKFVFLKSHTFCQFSNKNGVEWQI